MMPIVANPLSEWQKEREQYNSTIVYKTMALFTVFCFGCKQFSKAYFPYGIILRRSIPTTMVQQISYRAPIGALFLYMWYRQREYPRFARIDLTDPTEE